MASRSHASESPPAFRCLSAPLPPCFIPLSIFDKHFLEAMSVPGLCSVKNLALALALALLTAKQHQATSQGGLWAQAKGGAQERGSHGVGNLDMLFPR